MAVAARRDTRTVAEFRPDEERSDLIDGISLVMSPLSALRQRVVSNSIGRLDELVERQGRNALSGLDVPTKAMDDFAPAPEIFVTPGPLGPESYISDPELGGAVPVGALYTGLPL